MKQTKRILSVVLCLVMLLCAVPFTESLHITAHAYSTPSDISQATAVSRLHELVNKLGGDGSYFNTTRSTDCGTKSSGHSCTYCFTNNIVKQTWFKNLFGTISTDQFPQTYYLNGIAHSRAGYSCFGFGSFAEWYIFKSSNDDRVDTEYIGDYSLTYDDCSSHVKPGDLLRITDSHSVIAYEVTSGGLKVVDNNGTGSYNCQVHYRTLSYSGKSFSISRATNSADIPSHIDLGDDFYAYFEHYRTAMHLENTGSNVQLVSEGVDNYAPKQIWRFLRQSNGSYKIVSAYDGKCLDLHLADATNGANVKVHEDNGNNAQRWFIFNNGDGYGIRTACGDTVLDCAGGYTEPGTNIQIYESNGTDAQVFNIYKLDDDSLCQIISNLGNDFYAYLIQDSAWKHLENTGNNVQIAAGGNDSKDPKQIWHFLRQSNGGYKIISAYDGKCLDLYEGNAANRTNVHVYEDNGTKAQLWYIFSCGDGYTLRTATGTTVLDCQTGALGAGTNIQIFEFNETVAQIFSVYNVNKDGLTYSKPAKPDASTISVQALGEANETTTLSWTASPLKDNNFDSRSYTLTLTKDGEAYQTKKDLTATTIDLTLPAGTYTAQVRAINTKYANYYTDGNTVTFTVSDHTHSYTSSVTKVATCSATGAKTFTCSCGDTYTETIPVNSNNHVNTTNVAATASTCTVKGYTAGVYCNDCKKYISGHQEQPLVAHKTELRNQKNADCTTAGYTGDQYCTVCKQTITKGSAISALGHTAPDGNGNCTRCGTHIKDVTPTQPTQPSQPQTNPNACKWCGQVHTGFFGKIVGFFHSILAIFKR